MAKAWFKFFPANFVEATYSWPPATVGIYMRLLMYQFSNGSIPSDEESCIAIANCKKEEWKEAWAFLSGKFTAGDENGENPTRMVNLKMLKTRSDAEESYAKRVQAAAKSHESRRGKSSKANAMQVAKQLQGASGSSSGSGSSSKGSKKENYTDDFEKFWKAFPEGRKSGKKDAFKAWNENVDVEKVETVIASAGEYATSSVGQGEFVKGPATWIRKGCWDDSREAWKNKDSDSADHDTARRF